MADIDPSIFLSLLKPPADGPDQATIANALRGREQLGMLAQLSGNQTAQPFAQTVLKGVADERDSQSVAQQRAAQQRVTLMQAYQSALDKQADNKRQDAAAAETAQHHRYIEQHPQPIFQFGSLPGQAGPVATLTNPNTGKTRIVTDESGNPVGQAAKGGSANNPASEKEWGELAKGVSTGARGSLSKDIQKGLLNIEGLNSLVKLPDGSLANLTPQQLRELGTGVAGVISKGGSQAVSQIEHITPDSMAIRFADLKQKLTNEPQGGDAQAFTQNLLETLQREEKTSRRQLREMQMQAVPNYAHLRKADAKRFESILRGAHLDPAAIDENGLEIPVAPAGSLKPGEVSMMDAKGRPHAVAEADVKEAEAHGWKRR